MKIAYLMQEGGPDVRERPLGGPANHVWQVFRALQALGHEVRLLARWDGQLWRSDDLEHFAPVEALPLDRGWRRRLESFVRGVQSRLSLPYLNWFESRRFAAACCREFAGYDLLYERMGWMGYGGGLAAKRLGIPLVLEANNGDFVTELERLGIAPQGVQRWLSVALMRRAAHRSDHVVATGDGHGRRFVTWYRMPATRVTVVENGSELVDLLPRHRLPCFGAARDGEAPVLTFVGAFEPWHGIHVLLEAMARVAAALPEVQLKLIGTGSEWERVVARVEELGLDANVTLTGRLPIEQVGEQLVNSDIGLAPYCGWIEFSGLKLFDYKACGVAIIASGADGEPRTLQHGTTAWIVPPCDAAALSDAILRLAKDPDLRQRLGRQARIEAEAEHSWRHTAQRLVQIFEEVIAR